MADYNIERKSRSNYYKSHCRIYNPHVPPVTGADNDDVLKVVDGKWKDAPASGGKEVIFNVDNFTGTVTVSGIEYLNDKFSEGPIVPSDVRVRLYMKTYDSDFGNESGSEQAYYSAASVVSKEVDNGIYAIIEISFTVPVVSAGTIIENNKLTFNLSSSGEGYMLDGFSAHPTEIPEIGACFKVNDDNTLIFGDLLHAAFNDSDGDGNEYSNFEINRAMGILGIVAVKVTFRSPENIRLRNGNDVLSCIGITTQSGDYILAFYDFWNRNVIEIKFNLSISGDEMEYELEFYNPEPA